VLSSQRASRHVAAPSLCHYASLSFVVIGRGQSSDVRGQKADDREQKKELRIADYGFRNYGTAICTICFQL
jgi:hypothetical protein